MSKINITAMLFQSQNFYAVATIHHLIDDKVYVEWYRKETMELIGEWPASTFSGYPELESLLAKVRTLCEKKNFILWRY